MKTFCVWDFSLVRPRVRFSFASVILALYFSLRKLWVDRLFQMCRVCAVGMAHKLRAKHTSMMGKSNRFVRFRMHVGCMYFFAFS